MSDSASTSAQSATELRAACPVVAIGASAGGLEAFKSFFASVPADCGLAFVLVQHLSPDHPSIISELLAAATAMPITSVTEPRKIEPNHVYVIAPNTLLTIRHSVLRPETPREPGGHRAPIDLFFRSVAEDQGENAVGILLSGAGSDGAVGMQVIKRYGGLTLVQSPETSRYDSMPRTAIASGVVDHVLPVEEMAARLLDFFSYRAESVRTLGVEGIYADIVGSLPNICTLLTRSLGHDFSRYKQSTMVRRIQRRMQMQRLAPAAAYLHLLEKDPKEIEQLFKDLLISVTEFFRDREAFDSLARRVIPKLFTPGSATGTIRVWVSGCATGQEAYSIAILLQEYMARNHVEMPVKIFATDIDDEALDAARLGIYGEETAEQVSSERLARYFQPHDSGYQIHKQIREMCIFSAHNVITDPPFSRMDLVCCRNVLIYFDTSLQQRVIPLFHYALKSGGYLFLGSAESLGTHADSFGAIDQRMRIFQAKPSVATRAVRLPRVDGTRSNRIVSDSSIKLRLARERDAKELHERAVLDWYAPPSVLIDANGEVLHFVRRTSRYLEPPVGSPSFNLFDIVRDTLRTPLRAALSEARASGSEAIREHLEVEAQQEVQRLSLLVRPLKDAENPVERFIVIFREEGPPRARDASTPSPARQEVADHEAVQHLERELRNTKESLQGAIEELENSNEELKSSNEELISINEEYQSANESLQTSKEELQSLNEELETVNVELSKKVEELDRANADLQNLFASTPIATLFLDQQLRIKRFTPTATEWFNLIDTDLGRSLLDITAKFDLQPLLAQIERVNRGETPATVEIQKADGGRWFLGRVNRYHANDGSYDGVILHFLNVTDLKTTEAALRSSLEENQQLHEIGVAFASDLNLDSLLQKITDVATTVTRAAFGAFFYNALNEHGESYMLYTISGVPREAFEKFPMPRNTAVFEPTFRGTGPLRSDDITKDPRYGKNAPHHGMPTGHLPVVSYLAVPVVSSRGEVIGGLFFGHEKPGIFDAHAEQLAVGIAGQAAVALDNARMVEGLRRSARALETSEKHFRELADSMPQIIWASRPDGYTDYYNRRWYEFTGFQEGQTGDESWMPILHPDDLQRTLDTWRESIRTGTLYEIRYRFHDRQTGRYRWQLARALPIRDDAGNIVRWFGTCTDIDDLVHAEDALREAAERKDDFLAMLGHELRNPLAPVKTGLDILDLPDTSNEDGVRLREMLRRQIRHLTRIVDDLLDVARISRGKVLLRKEPVDLGALVQTAIADYRVSIQSSGLSLHLEIPTDSVWIEGDSTRVCQVISNLLQNAAKFSDADGQVHVRLERHEGRARLTIRDTGMGMEPATIARLFQPFNQADNSLARSRGGLGLGLALVRGLVELHGGTVRAESPGLGHGSTVTVELPLTDLRPTGAHHTAGNGASCRRIVIIEDNADAAFTLAHLLRRRGHEVFTAAHGAEGIALVQTHRAEVLLCDIGLPGELDGYAVARAVRSVIPPLPILMIALTGYGREQDQQRANEAGFTYHLTKPIAFEELDSLLAEWKF